LTRLVRRKRRDTPVFGRQIVVRRGAVFLRTAAAIFSICSMVGVRQLAGWSVMLYWNIARTYVESA
jgi:hypothetical protein